jgi:uncharacterized protein (DUF2249 family)
MLKPGEVKVRGMSSQIVILDVREDIRAGREPFTKIMKAVAELRPDERLLLIAPFEPQPLYAVLGKQGFVPAAKQLPSGDWEVLFTRNGIPANAGQTAPASRLKPPPPEAAGGRVVDVDARGLEPPQPLVKILESLAQLPAGAELRARTDRRPMHLYAQLEERGFRGETEEQTDGSFITKIRAA